jgi:hypothetical protein
MNNLSIHSPFPKQKLQKRPNRAFAHKRSKSQQKINAESLFPSSIVFPTFYQFDNSQNFYNAVIDSSKKSTSTSTVKNGVYHQYFQSP